MSNILQLNNVSKAFGGIKAVTDVSFSVKEGEIVGLIGPNGAGKTTLVNLITGVHKLSAGNMTFMGKDITNFKPYMSVVDYLAHNSIENFKFYLKQCNKL